MKTQIKIAKETPFKSAPRKEVVDIVMKVFKSQPLKVRKHTKGITILKSVTNGDHVISGRFYYKKGIIKISDHDSIPVELYESTTVHEFAHLRFHWLLKYHKDELIEFCEVVNKLPAPTRYIRGREKTWRLMYSSNLISNNTVPLHLRAFNEYANEYHSALAQIKLREIKEHFHRCLLTEGQLKTAMDAYDKLWEVCS